MTTLVCPHCGVYANFTHKWSSSSYDDPWSSEPWVSCYTCDGCSLPIAAVRNQDTRDIETYWPVSTTRKKFPDVPEAIAIAACEAHVCLTAGSPRGAVAVARAVLEAVAKHKGIKHGGIQAKIDALYAAGLISEAMKEAAEEIRFAGNEAAHGDLIGEQLSIEDADEIVSLMDSILERIYQEPAQVERIRAKRERRTKVPAGGNSASD
jgi:hypothetical protein